MSNGSLFTKLVKEAEKKNTESQKTSPPVNKILNDPPVKKEKKIESDLAEKEELICGRQLSEFVDGLPSTNVSLPSTNLAKTANVDGKPSTNQKPAVHISNNVPSTNIDRHYKNVARYDNRINIKILQQIKQFCLNNDMTQKDFAELSAVKLIEMWTASRPHLNQNVDGLPSHDDRRLMISWKTKGHIINLHLQYTSILNPKTKWTVNDDEKAFHLNEVNSKVVELGIIQTQFQKGFKGKINSFSYYLNEIDNFLLLEMSEEILNTMIKINRQRWQQMTGKEIDYSAFEEK